MLSLPFNSSTPVLWVNRDAWTAAGVDPDMDLSTWENVGDGADQLKDAGSDCPYDDRLAKLDPAREPVGLPQRALSRPRRTVLRGLDTELAFNAPLQVKHIQTLGEWAKDGKFIYAGRRNEGGANFRAGECALFTESSAGYAGIKSEAKFDFDMRPLPYWADVEGAPQNTIIGGASLWVMAGQTGRGIQGRCGVPRTTSQLGRSAGKMASGHRLSADHQAAAELTREQGFYDENPGTDIAVNQMTMNDADRELQGHSSGQLRPDPHRSSTKNSKRVWAGDKDAQDRWTRAVNRGNELLRRFEQANR